MANIFRIKNPEKFIKVQVLIHKNSGVGAIRCEGNHVQEAGGTYPQAETTPKMKRLMIELPEPLHRAIKMKAVSQCVPMADMLRELEEGRSLALLRKFSVLPSFW